jgi:hypothetical protein
MNTFTMINGYRYFDGETCDVVGHDVGDRHRFQGGLDDEWDGESWASVCPDCDVAMRDRDDAARLRCGDCLTLAHEVVRRS